MKLLAVVARRTGYLPLPLSLMASGVVQHDLPVAKQMLEDRILLNQGPLYANKAHIDFAWAITLKKGHAIELITPRKKRKEDSFVSGDTFFTFVSSVRQPIECFFNWLNGLTAIQNASSVRSLSGLLLHLFGRITAALTALIFTP